MWNVVILAPDRLQYEERSGGKNFTVTIMKIDGRFRSWHSVGSDGNVFIRNGKLRNGRDTSSFELCGGLS